MRTKRLVILSGLLCGALVLAGACSDDDNPPVPDTGADAAVDDSSTGDDAAGDAAGDATGDAIVDPCAGKADGDTCGPTENKTICLSGSCVASYCGDGYVDTNIGESCEDGNEVAGDGCTACVWDCEQDSHCADNETCNGDETCNTTTHICEAGTDLADATDCTQSDNSPGKCKSGFCGPAGCGNGVVESGEDCDDQNSTPADGCESDCTFSCTQNSDCDDLNACNGAETCNTTTHICEAGTDVNCTIPSGASTGCTVQCDTSTGNCIYADVDQDGVTCDTDCKDNDPVVYPGATECNDSKDNDCNNKVDDNPTDCICYYDGDGDGYAKLGAATKLQVPPCPTNYTEKNPASIEDCQDYRSDVKPGQTAWFTSSYCKSKLGPYQLCLKGNTSWDYNCDGAITKQYPNHVGCKWIGIIGGPLFCTGSGWSTSSAVPACGAKGTWITCKDTGGKCLGLINLLQKTQACH